MTRHTNHDDTTPDEPEHSDTTADDPEHSDTTADEPAPDDSERPTTDPTADKNDETTATDEPTAGDTDVRTTEDGETTADTATWQRVRESVREQAAETRETGATVWTAFADHGAATGGDRPTFAFTVPDDTADDLAASGFDGTTAATTVSYTDTGSHRVYVLTCRGDERVVILAGGVRHGQLAALADDATDETTPARTIVRRASGEQVLRLDHARLAPFLSKH